VRIGNEHLDMLFIAHFMEKIIHAPCIKLFKNIIEQLDNATDQVMILMRRGFDLPSR
jgi:predicted glycosyltransferase